LSRSRSDVLLVAALRAAAVLSGAITLLIAVFLALESWPALRAIGVLRFFEDPSWNPTEGRYGLTPMLVGTLAAMAGAVLLATPLGILSALFCQYYAPWRVASVYRRLIELLAGIPSVVYGLWGLMVLVPRIGAL